MTNISDILNKHIEKAVPRQSILGTITAMKSGGIGNVSLTDGTMIKNIGIPFAALEGDSVVCQRPVGSGEWIVLGRGGGYSTASGGSASPDEDVFISRPPYNVRAVGGYDFIGVLWDSWPDFVGAYEVQISPDETYTDISTTMITSGTVFIEIVLIQAYIRVRSVSKKFALSSWSAWTYAERGGSLGITFLSLLDTPSSYVGQANMGLAVSVDETALVFTNLVRAFLDLTDTPASYVGQANKGVAVTSGESGLTFTSLVKTLLDLTDTPGSYAGQAKKLLAIRADEAGVEFVESSGSGGGEIPEPELEKIQIETHRWHGDGALSVTDEMDGVWVLTKDGYLSYLWVYVETPGTAGDTTAVIEKSTNGVIWTEVARLSLPYDYGKIRWKLLEHRILANALLRVNIESIADGARNITVQTATGLSALSLLPLMGIS